MEALQTTGAIRTRGARFAIATPQKLPIDVFNEWRA